MVRPKLGIYAEHRSSYPSRRSIRTLALFADCPGRARNRA